MLGNVLHLYTKGYVYMLMFEYFLTQQAHVLLRDN